MYLVVKKWSLKCLANDRTAKLHEHGRDHASFGSHQMQPFHSVLPAVQGPTMGQN